MVVNNNNNNSNNNNTNYTLEGTDDLKYVLYNNCESEINEDRNFNEEIRNGYVLIKETGRRCMW